MRLTKLQKEFMNKNITPGSYVAFPLSMFKSKEYKEWKKERRKRNNGIS